MPAPSLAERYVAEGYDLERLPLPAPFDFLATGKDRVAAFASADRVPASTLVDVRLMARELGAKAVFVAASFSDEARRIADRFGIELVVTPPRESEAHAPAAPPPESFEDLPLHAELRFGESSLAAAREDHAAPPVGAVAEHGITTHDFDEFPTPDELRQELAEVNRVLGPHPALTPAQATEVALAEAATDDDVLAIEAPDFAFLPRELPTHVEMPDAGRALAGLRPGVARFRAAEAAISHHPAEEVQEDLAQWYEELCRLEAADHEAALWGRVAPALEAVDTPAVAEVDDDIAALMDRGVSLPDGSDLADWYDALIELESHTLAQEIAEEAAFTDLAPLALHGHAALGGAVEFAAGAEAAAAFRDVEAAIPVLENMDPPADVPPPFPELVWSEVEELTPMARAGRVLAAEPHFGAPERGAVAFRSVEDGAPELPSFAFSVPTSEPEAPTEAVVAPDPAPVEAPAAEEPETFTIVESPFLNPASVLPWTPNAPMPVAGFVPATPVVAGPAPPVEVVDAETGAIAAIDTPTPTPRAMLPWTPTVRGPASGPDPTLFADAFAKAQAWNTVQRIEAIRQEAHHAVVQASDAPKPKTVTHVADDRDFELL